MALMGEGREPRRVGEAPDSEQGSAERLLTLERDLGIALGGVRVLDDAVAAVIDAVLQIEPFDCGGLYLIDPKTGELRLRVARGLSEEFLREASCYAPDSQQTKLASRGVPVFLDYGELARNLSHETYSKWTQREGLRVIAVVPVFHGSAFLGCINASSHTSTAVPESARHALESIASHIGSTVVRIRAEDALRASEERLRVVYENARDGILLANVASRHFVDANRAICDMLGYSLDEIRELGLADIHPPESLAYVAEHFEQQSIGCGYTAPDIPVLRKDGTVFYADVSSAPLELHGEHFLLGIFRDVTERQRMQAEVQKAQRLESVGVLAGGIAHDFNNILTTITGNISLAKLKASQDPAMGQLLKAAERGALRARDLTMQLLTFARGGSPIRRPAAMNELIRESAEFALRGSAVGVRYELADNLWNAQIDPGQIGRVIQNLVINAAQATEGGGQIEVLACNHEVREPRVGPLPPGRYVRVSVIDHGCGIRAEDLPRIFEPYFTTRQTGTGLGLAVTYSVVAKHDGHIDVESKVGEGAKFHVYLPAARAEAAPKPEAAEAPFRGSGRVLLMDDDALVLETASRMLTTVGYEVVTARDGAEAIELYRQAQEHNQPFGVVILDLTVPGAMGGIKCAAALRELDPTVRLMVSSGYSDDPAMAEPARYGIRGVIAKPYRLEELVEALRRERGLH